MSNSLLIVGGGITGAATYHFLSERFIQSSLFYSIDIWEKSNAIGGRMNTYRNPEIPSIKADMGAQYLSVQSNRYDKVYDYLENQHVISPLNQYIENVRDDHHKRKHYLATDGLDRVVNCLFQSSKVHYDHSVTSLSMCETRKQYKVTYSTTNEYDRESYYDIVFLCLPKPALLSIHGNWKSQSGSIIDKIENVKYSCR